MTEFSEIARNKSRLRAACKNLSVEQLKTMANCLSEFIEKRAQEEVALAEQVAKKHKEKQAILTSIAKAGLTPEDFFATDLPKIKKPRKPVAPTISNYRSAGRNTPMVWSRSHTKGI